MSLDDLSIQIPCHASWEEMKGDARVRFCGQCKLNVYNLSAMPRREAEALVEQKEGRLCVRFFRRPDGTVVTRDCGLLRAARRKAAWAWGVGSAAAMALVVWGASFLPRLVQPGLLAKLPGKQAVRPFGTPCMGAPK